MLLDQLLIEAGLQLKATHATTTATNQIDQYEQKYTITAYETCGNVKTTNSKCSLKSFDPEAVYSFYSCRMSCRFMIIIIVA